MQELIWPKFIGKQQIDLKLDRVAQLLSRLGNPQNKLENVIHVAGTNGKGSTIAFLNSLLASDNNVYTSPHLVNFNERITLSGKHIGDTKLQQVLQHCKEHEEQSPQINTTFFEGTTVAAFVAFAQNKAPYNLIETGLGGRLDATNIFTHKLAAIITPIDYDHMEFLGNNLSDIALEKIAITDNAEKIIIAKQNPEIIPTLKNYLKAKDKKDVLFFGEDFSYNIDNDLYIYTDKNSTIKIKLDSIPLAGKHQLDNLTVAIAALSMIKKDYCTEAEINKNIVNTKWPARIQKIDSGKFIKLINDNSVIYLDGGHNIHAANALAEWIKQQNHFNKIKILFTIAEEKDPEKFIKIIAPYIDELNNYQFHHERNFVSYDKIENICKKLEITSKQVGSIAEYFADSKTNCLYLICGSLFLAGEFIKQNNSSSLS